MRLVYLCHRSVGLQTTPPIQKQTTECPKPTFIFQAPIGLQVHQNNAQTSFNFPVLFSICRKEDIYGKIRFTSIYKITRLDTKQLKEH